MNELQKNIIQIAEQTAEKLGLLLVDVSFKGDNRSRIVEVFIDSRSGVSVDDCAEMSREMASVLDSADLITSKYRLDVSSPGVERPLKFMEQYFKHLNRKFEVTYTVPMKNDGTGNETIQETQAEAPPAVELKKITGKLVGIDGDVLTFKVNNEEVPVNFNTIKTAKVLISF
ncbi:MAG TPA: ribosome maturation factor RimP [Ignavibacteriales bacterium]|nr:ribosome maturation factor RimP [Ignavibacteriales bacterium]